MENKGKKKRLIVMSIMTYYARQIFNETKPYEFRKSFLRESDLNEKIYIYSAKEDKALIGYVKVDEMLSGSCKEILEQTGYDTRPDRQEIVDYFKGKEKGCIALHLYDITEFEKYLTLKQIRSIDPDIRFPQYWGYIYESDPLYDIVIKWDKTYSMDGQVKSNPSEVQQLIRERERKNGKI